MRVRAYVDDVRWTFAVSLSPDSSPSQIVQAGLVRLIESRHSATVADPQSAVPATRRRLRDLAEKVYTDGYRAGLRACAALDWAQLDSLAGDGWQQAALDAICLAVGAGPPDEDLNTRTTLYRTGLREALSNVWRGTRATTRLES